MAVQFNRIAGGSGTANASGVAPTIGIEGGGVVNAPSLQGKDFFRDGMDASWGDNMPEFFSGMFADRLAAAKQERMWQGFVRAREGATMEQINEEQPWFSRMFGPTDYARGASMYTTMKTLADYENDMMSRMHELRELPADEMGREFNRMAESLRTGDDFTDAIVHKTMMSRAGVLMDEHTKHRTAWLQSQQVNLQAQAQTSASAAFNRYQSQRASLGEQSPEDPAFIEQGVAARINFRDAFVIPAGMNPAVAAEAMDATVRGMLDRGEFFSFYELRDGGFLNVLGAEKLQQLDELRDRKEREYKQEWAMSPQVIEQIAKVQSLKEMGIGGEPAAALALQVNAEYAKTGARQPFYTVEEVGNIAGAGAQSYISRRERIQDRMEARAERAATEENKAAAEARNVADMGTAFLSGGAGQALFAAPDRAGNERIMAQSWMQLRQSNPAVAQGVLVQNSSGMNGVTIQPVVEMLRNEVESSITEQYTDGFNNAYQNWRAMRDSPGVVVENGEARTVGSGAHGRAAVIKYYGEAINSRMERYDRALRQGIEAPVAYRMAFGEDLNENGIDLRGLDKKSIKQYEAEFAEAIDDQDSGFFGRMFGGQTMHPSTRSYLSARSAYFFGQLDDPTLLPKDRAKQAVIAARENGLEIGGSFARDNARDQRPIQTYLGLPNDPNQFGKIVNETVSSAARKAGVTDLTNSSVTIVRLPDQNGEPILSAVVWDNNKGQMLLFNVRGSDMKRVYDEERRGGPFRNAAPLQGPDPFPANK